MNQTPKQVSELADALWQLLNDMHPGGQSVCLFAKAKARLAYEPFRDEPEDECGIMSLADAQSIIDETDRISSPAFSLTFEESRRMAFREFVENNVHPAKPTSDRMSVGE